MEIKLIITDFDGTLVDTFEANFNAYKQAFETLGLSLDEDTYRRCFGMRFDDFMATVGVNDEDTAREIRLLKGEFYPLHFGLLKPNHTLLDFIRKSREAAIKTAVASTARRKNLENALTHIGAMNNFDLILAGEDVTHGKPNPEIYQTVMQRLAVKPEETLVFEDSEVGIEAAKASGANYIKVL